MLEDAEMASREDTVNVREDAEAVIKGKLLCVEMAAMEDVNEDFRLAVTEAVTSLESVGVNAGKVKVVGKPEGLKTLLAEDVGDDRSVKDNMIAAVATGRDPGVDDKDLADIDKPDECVIREEDIWLADMYETVKMLLGREDAVVLATTDEVGLDAIEETVEALIGDVETKALVYGFETVRTVEVGCELVISDAEVLVDTRSIELDGVGDLSGVIRVIELALEMDEAVIGAISELLKSFAGVDRLVSNVGKNEVAVKLNTGTEPCVTKVVDNSVLPDGRAEVLGPMERNEVVVITSEIEEDV